MYSFEYPGGKPFFVTKETVEKTPHTFNLSRGIWEPMAIRYFYNLVAQKHNNKDAVIVDVGAQSGLFSLYAKFLPECKFLAFEPFEDSYNLLVENAKINDIKNIVMYKGACGSKTEQKILHVPEHLGLNTLGDTPTRFSTWKDIQVNVVKLDDILLNEKSFDYLKCDTEGWEYHVLKGAEESIRKWKPELFLEINGDNLAQCSLNEDVLVDYLKSLDYCRIDLKDDENAHFTYRGP
jgi:FkbM family methyltransferase